jgi:dTDP-4-amino-4,6-dideoxygalactose transaminase
MLRRLPEPTEAVVLKGVTPTMQVPFFRYPHLFLQQRDEILATVMDVMERGAYIMQRDLEQLEEELAAFTGAQHAVGVANGTDGLMLALRSVGVGPGDEVIVPSHTYVASAAAIHYLGAEPVLVECGADHLIDPASAEAAVTSRTRAIMPVQLNGRTCDMDAIQAIAERHGLVIVEDAAQALGSKYKEKGAGTFGAAGEFSFYPAKVLGCFGDGGGVVTSDSDVAMQLRLLRDHGRNDDGEFVAWGVNSRLDNLQAAILSARMRHFPAEIERRREIARRYRERLQDLDDLALPPGPDGDPDHFDVYQNYELEAGRRDELREHLSREGIGTLIQWGGKPVHQIEALGFSEARLPQTDRLFERCFMLPMNTSLTDDEVDYVSESIRRFYGHQA